MQVCFLRQSTATVLIVGQAVDDVDGITAETAIDVTTITCDLYKHADAIPGTATDLITSVLLAATSDGTHNKCVHVARGRYAMEVKAANVDTVGRGRFCFTVSGAIIPDVEFVVVPADIYDALVSNTNTNSNSTSSPVGQLRRVHALVGGTKATQDAGETNMPIHHRNEADSGNLVTTTMTVATTVTTTTPS